MKKTILLLLTSILLAGCTARATATVASVANASTATATKKPRPTNTLVPTFTPEPTLTPDPRMVTQEAALASCMGDSQTPMDQFLTQAYLANRFWSATVCQDDGIYTKVVELGKDKIYKVPAIDKDLETPGPEWVWEPYLWSVGGDYLYLQPRYLGSSTPESPYLSGFGLNQLDLESGARNVLLQPRQEGYNFALSGDGRLFAYLTDIPRTIRILDLKTKERLKLSFDRKYNLLDMRWTPDGARLILLTEELAANPTQSGFTIFEYSLEGRDLTKLVDKNNLNSLFSLSPSAEPRIFISGLTNEILFLADNLQEGYFQVNLKTGDVVQTNDLGTPTASP